ncbi:MAG TPA: HAMP domain-containing sensor histidine kinase [Acidimicrobiales bacterium]|nr:HAMP domain-containing sensor histidine kinase [Acidimicrobiales bacterium]
MAVADSVALRYAQADSWKKADLSDSLTLASHAGLAVEVRDNAGALVAARVPTRVRRSSLGPPIDLPVFEKGTRLGTVSVRTGPIGIGAAAVTLRRTLAAAVWWSAAAAAVLAVLAGIVVSRRITRPVVALITAARAMASGARTTRVGDLRAPGEMADLSRAFDQMADALEREDHLRRMLVADVAHELRTPLAIVRAATEAMADGIIEPDAAALSSLHDETLRLGRIVEDLEVLASADAAVLTVDRRPVDLAVVAALAADALQPHADSAGLTLMREFRPVVVLGDATRLHQIITNLVTNAIKFTPAGGSVTLGVALRDRRATIVVQDTGVGISPADISHIFDRFWRAPSVRQIAGSGIGLAVVQELVRSHGGDVEVTSHEGEGSCFVVTLPSV